MNVNPPTLAVLEGLLNRSLELDAQARDARQALNGRVVEVKISGLPQSVFAVFTTDRVLLEHAEGRSADVVVEGSPLALLRLLTQTRTRKTSFGPDVSVSGDIEVMGQLGDFAAGLDPDWEEQLALWFGDSAGHGLARFLGSVGRWGRQTHDTVWLDLVEYLQEESRLLATREEVCAYVCAVDDLRDDVDRLSVRVSRLPAARKDSSAPSSCGADSGIGE